jgi:hypothetical protein
MESGTVIMITYRNTFKYSYAQADEEELDQQYAAINRHINRKQITFQNV